jgi:hypothetical protein
MVRSPISQATYYGQTVKNSIIRSCMIKKSFVLSTHGYVAQRTRGQPDLPDILICRFHLEFHTATEALLVSKKSYVIG